MQQADKSLEEDSSKIEKQVTDDPVLPVENDSKPPVTATVPDGGYGWVVVFCQFTINAMTWGVNATYAVYLSQYLANDYFPGATTLQYSFIGGLSVSMAMLITPIATYMNNRLGFRVPLFLGLFLESGSFVAASFAKELWQLALTQGVFFGFGMGLLFGPSISIPPQWFNKRRALATGICAAGSGVGGILFALSTNAMIQNISLAWAFRITAIVTFVMNGLAVILLREFTPRTTKIGFKRSVFDHTVFRHSGFGYILGWGFVSLFGYVTIQFTIPRYATAYAGLTQTQGSNLASVLSAGMAIGRPLVGLIADRYGRINISILFTLLCGLTCFFIWMFAVSYGVLVFFCLLNGTIAGVFWSMSIPVTAEIVGMGDLNAAASIVWLAMTVPTTFSTAVSLGIVGDSGEYKRLIGFAGTMYVVAAVILYPAKVKKQERVGGQQCKWKVFVKT